MTVLLGIKSNYLAYFPYTLSPTGQFTHFRSEIYNRTNLTAEIISRQRIKKSMYYFFNYF